MSDAASSRGGEVLDVLILNSCAGRGLSRQVHRKSPDGAQVTVKGGDPCADCAILEFSLDNGSVGMSAKLLRKSQFRQRDNAGGRFNEAVRALIRRSAPH